MAAADEMELMSKEEVLAVASLQSKGYAVIVWTPEELKDANPDRVQDRLIELGWDVIEDLQMDDDDRLTKS